MDSLFMMDGLLTDLEATVVTYELSIMAANSREQKGP